MFPPPLAAGDDHGILYDVHGSATGYELAADQTGEGLSNGNKALLAEIYRHLESDPMVNIGIYGYTDSSGSDGDNRTKSTRRARKVEDYLLALGLPEERVIEVKGMGTLDPIADNSSAEGRRMNRRVEVSIVRMTSAPVERRPERFAVGLGYPDIRARVALGYGWDVEAKFAFEQGIQVYSGRLYWNFLDFGPVKVVAGAEEGFARFDAGLYSINGTGSFTEGFLGLEYPFARRLSLSIDAGPARIQATSEGFSYSSTQLIYNTALYIYLF